MIDEADIEITMGRNIVQVLQLYAEYIGIARLLLRDQPNSRRTKEAMERLAMPMKLVRSKQELTGFAAYIAYWDIVSDRVWFEIVPEPKSNIPSVFGSSPSGPVNYLFRAYKLALTAGDAPGKLMRVRGDIAVRDRFMVTPFTDMMQVTGSTNL